MKKILLSAAVLFVYTAIHAQEADLIIKNGKLMDGTGNQWQYKDIAISKNKITSRNVNYKLLIPKITIEKTIILNKREFYTGFGVTGNLDQLNYIGVEGLYRTKKKQAFGLGIGVNQDLIPVVSGRMYWKLGK